MTDARRLALALYWLLAFVSFAPVPGTTDSATPSPGTAASVPAPDGPAVDNTVTRISVRASGDATWAVVIRTRLETQREVDQYRSFQARFRNNTSRYLDTYRERIRSVVADAETVTGREMRATSFSASTDVQEVPRRWGVTTYRFRWANFSARPNATALVVGDVFQGGYYLDADDIFAVEAPEGYAVDTVSPAPDERGSRVVRWFGPSDFADQRPRAVFRVEASDEPTMSTEGLGAATARGTTEAGADSTDSSSDGSGRLLVGLGLVAFGAAAAVVWRLQSGGADSSPADSGLDVASDAPRSDGPAPVRTDAEKVEALLRERGGRMKQAEMARVLDWSASKTSRVLSDLEDDGAVERVRIGRENVVDLSTPTDE
ncbi:helix-turn-helix transcriptional regulator [Halorussus sp. AFM4]|uniref:helix-turn-helix transcriptional regulator n=1 Tax=Halorussus sp. AFM4 TaxID=3421651 RepID=UPI003EB761B2